MQQQQITMKKKKSILTVAGSILNNGKIYIIDLSSFVCNTFV